MGAGPTSLECSSWSRNCSSAEISHDAYFEENIFRSPSRPGSMMSMIDQRSSMRFSMGVPVSPIVKSAFADFAAWVTRDDGFLAF